jgi:hypothetical protein
MQPACPMDKIKENRHFLTLPKNFIILEYLQQPVIEETKIEL